MGKSEMVYIEITKLKLNPKNPRKNDGAVDTVMKSIEKYGFKNPLIADSNFVVYCGNTRLKAAKKLGLKEVPVIIADDLTPEQIRKYALIDNKSSEIADWDFELLEKELAELDLADFDVDWGITAHEPLQELVEDETPEVDEESEPICKLGDIWQLGEHRLICGDSTDKATVEKLMDAKTADMEFTDPPYGIEVVDKNGKIASGKVCKPNTYRPIIGDNSTETARKAYLVFSQLCDKLIIWGGNYFDFLPHSDGVLIWDKREDVCKNDFSDGELAWCSFHTVLRIYHQLWNGMLKKGETGRRLHPTQKPIKMLGNILKDFTKDGEIILDVFGGSGSTLIACEQLNRKCYMSELDPHYCDVIIKRWENLTNKKAVKL